MNSKGKTMTIEFANWNEQHKLATIQKGKFSVYISNGLDFESDAVIWKFITDSLIKLYGERTKDYYDVVGNLVEGGLFFFDTEEQAWEFYGIFEQELTDSSNVYACIYSPVYGCMTENT
jgi:hypothetical protein